MGKRDDKEHGEDIGGSGKADLLVRSSSRSHRMEATWSCRRASENDSRVGSGGSSS
jgi:hypothetical protein